MASGPAEETAALNRFRQNPFHAGGLAELEYQGTPAAGAVFVRPGPEGGRGVPYPGRRRGPAVPWTDDSWPFSEQ